MFQNSDCWAGNGSGANPHPGAKGLAAVSQMVCVCQRGELLQSGSGMV